MSIYRYLYKDYGCKVFQKEHGSVKKKIRNQDLVVITPTPYPPKMVITFSFREAKKQYSIAPDPYQQRYPRVKY